MAGSIGAIKGIINVTDSLLAGRRINRTEYLVQGEGFEEGIVFTEDELTSLEMAAEQRQPLTVEEVRNLKRDAENKIDDILETLRKELGPRSHIEVVTFDFDEMQRIIAGKRYNTKIKVFVS